MKPSHLLLTLLLVLTALALSACGSSSAMTASSWPGLSTAPNHTAYLAEHQFVYAVNTASGAIRWTYPADKGDRNKTFFAAPVLTTDGQLLISGYDNTLYSVDADNGQENWAFAGATNRYVGPPLATESYIYAPNADGHLYALDLRGNLQWDFRTPNPLWAPPAYAQDTLYLGAMDHHLYALDATTGAVRWSTSLDGAMVDAPTLSPDGATLYIGTFANEVVAVDTTDGRILWRTATEGWVWASPALRDGMLYVGDLSGRFYALNAADGAIIWQIQPDGPITAAPLLTEQSLYLATEAGTLYALDFDGNIRWQQSLKGKLHTRPALSDNGLILVAPLQGDALLYAFNEDGQPAWSVSPPAK